MKKYLFLLASLASTFTFAEQDPYETCVAEIGQKTGVNNTAVVGCAEQSAIEFEAEIKEYYNKIYTALKAADPKSAEQFKQAQQAWLTYRDKQCKLAGAYIGSSMYATCPMELNEARSEELAEMAQSF